MPGMNGTGPMGQGAMTGRGMGRCNTKSAVGTAVGTAIGLGAAVGYGCRMANRHMGRRGGFGRRFNISLEDEKQMLEERLSEINGQMKG